MVNERINQHQRVGGQRYATHGEKHFRLIVLFLRADGIHDYHDNVVHRHDLHVIVEVLGLAVIRGA